MITRRACGDAVRTRGDFVADRGAEGDMPFAAARARRTRWAWAAACSRARGRRRWAWADIGLGRRADGVEPGGGKLPHSSQKVDGCRRNGRLRTELEHEHRRVVSVRIYVASSLPVGSAENVLASVLGR